MRCRRVYRAPCQSGVHSQQCCCVKQLDMRAVLTNDNFQDTNSIMLVAMTDWKAPRTSIDMLTVRADWITCVSADMRLISSPVRLVSKNPVSWLSIDA